MNRKLNKYFCFGFVMMFISFWSNAQQSKERPNIIFIITDDQQVGLLGIEGSDLSVTPNIDRIGQEGAIFNNAFVVTPLCSPSRASFLTGNYAHKHNVINNDKLGLDVISHTLLTWPRQLREAGYETAFIGKWHMGLDDSRRPGYDRWFSFKGQGEYIDGVVNDEGQRLQTTGNMTDIINLQAIRYLNEHNKKKPFAMIVAHKAVHWPILPSKRHEGLYPDFEFDSLTVSKEDLKGKPLLTRKVDRVPLYTYENVLPEMPESRRGRGKDRSSVVGDEYRCLMSVDDGVGQMFEILENQGVIDNTIIIYVSDNGMLMGEHGQFNMKRWAYDPVIRIPMLMRYPKHIEPGSVRDQMVLNIDVAPTLLEYAGVSPLEPMQGQSMVSILENENTPWRTSFLTEYFMEKVVVKVPPWQAVRTEKWKYITYNVEGISAELYNLEVDPKEENNLISNKSAKIQIQVMEKKLAQLLQETK